MRTVPSGAPGSRGGVGEKGNPSGSGCWVLGKVAWRRYPAEPRGVPRGAAAGGVLHGQGPGPAGAPGSAASAAGRGAGRGGGGAGAAPARAGVGNKRPPPSPPPVFFFHVRGVLF